ncbi:L,D-transpeptidase family protein [Sphingosinithalassobacter sp. LHW66-3]|uniref:L,D-transpeptidase family protein n=1 Tax=Sphingosinithalassobacter sp. LHW66-3 TaxID=3424718 RepID=UPI003D6B5454
MPRIARSTFLALTAAGGIGLALPTSAQTARPAPAPSPTPLVQPLPGSPAGMTPAAVAPRPLPVLSAQQAVELSALLADLHHRQGLRYGPTDARQPLAGDALVRAALDYARAVHSGRLAAEDFQSDWGLRPDPYDPLPAFAEAVAKNRLEQWLRALPPPYAGYDGLRDGLARYRQVEASGGWREIPAGAPLREGDTGARVQALRTRLAVEDAQVVVTGQVFDAELTEAVKRAQARYGLGQDGIVGGRTLRALNKPVAERIRQIMANMERWRWMPRELQPRRIQVNIAAAVLTVFDEDRPTGSMRAVTGAPGHETPMLRSEIHSVVLNPPWNVPTSIANAELWPKERSNPGYLARNGFRVIDLGNGNSRLQQRAGDLSALGRYKFDFPNPYAVYLHDTPAQAAFDRQDRLASHGCVRLARPAALARMLLADNPDWQPEAIDATIASGETTRAELTASVPVYLLYWTAYATPDGGMVFLDDPYDWDRTLAAKIERRAAQQLAAN